MHVKLVVIDGDVKTSEVRLKVPAIIGRGRGASLQIPQALVSRQHCELTFVDGKLRVRDLGSLNGTIVDGKKVPEAEVPSGHTLTIGSVTFRVEYGEATGSSGDWKLPTKSTFPASEAAPAAAPAEEMFVGLDAHPVPPHASAHAAGLSSKTSKGEESPAPEPAGDGKPNSDVMSGIERGSGLLPPLAEPASGAPIPTPPAAVHFSPPPAPLAIPVAAPAALTPPGGAPVAPPAGPVASAAKPSDDDDEDLRAFLQSLGK